MCQETLEIHHGRHHLAYVTALNSLTAQDEMLLNMSLEHIIRFSIDKQSLALQLNNAGQHWNHLHFWNALSPGTRGACASGLGGVREPLQWPFDGCIRRESVCDHDQRPPCVVRSVGWHLCMKCRREFFSSDVVRIRL